MKNWKHQDIAIERFWAKDFFGLLFDCGTGKTRTAIQIASRKKRSNTVIAPKNTCKQWKAALIDSGVSAKDIFIYDSSEMKKKKVKKAFQEFLENA